MARRFRKCVIDGCERRSQLGQMVCKDHEGTELGVASSRQVVKLEREIKSLALAESEEERRVAAKRFQRRVARGDFAAIFSGTFQALLKQGEEQDLRDMAGALQVAVVRLLMEERDPTKMASALAKVAHAYSTVMRTEHHLNRSLLDDEEFALDMKLATTNEEYVEWRLGKSPEDIFRDRELKEQQVKEEGKVIDATWAESK